MMLLVLLLLGDRRRPNEGQYQRERSTDVSVKHEDPFPTYLYQVRCRVN
jgi:hypothetical protein